MSLKIFISSNKNEFIEERLFLKDKLMSDPVLSNFVEIFLFEDDVESSSRAPIDIYIDQVHNSDIYIGILGYTYGTITSRGISATELEYNEYKKYKSDYYFFVKNMEDREEKTKKFINKIQNETTYIIFNTKEELLEEIKRTLYSFINKRISSPIFDNQIIELSSSDNLDEQAYNSYFNSISDNGLSSLNGYRNKWDLLDYLCAGKKRGNDFRFNNAGALFFTNDIQKFNIEHEIKMVRFEGKDRLNILDYKESHAPIPLLLDEVEQFFRRNTRHGMIVKDFGRIAIPEYPFEAIREAIVNAIAHRDYNIYGNTITFYIYSDRIEIINPGKSLVPLDRLGKSNPIHRNENICNIFRYTKYMEHVGTGILRMRNAMSEEGLREPEFHNFSNEFQVVFWGRNGLKELPKEITDDDKVLDLKNMGLKNRQIKALKLILNHDKSINADYYSKKFNVSKSTASRDLNDLVDKNLITKERHKKEVFFVKNY